MKRFVLSYIQYIPWQSLSLCQRNCTVGIANVWYFYPSILSCSFTQQTSMRPNWKESSTSRPLKRSTTITCVAPRRYLLPMLSTQHSENNLYTEQQSLVTFFFLYFHCTDAIFLSLRSLVLYTFCFFPAFISFLTLLLLLAGFTERIFQPQFDQCMYHFLSVNSQAHPLLVLCPPYPSVCLLVYTMFRQKCVMWNKDLCQLYIFHCYLQLSVEYPSGVWSCMINTRQNENPQPLQNSASLDPHIPPTSWFHVFTSSIGVVCQSKP